MIQRLFILLLLLTLTAPVFSQSAKPEASSPAAPVTSVSENHFGNPHRRFKVQPLTLSGEKLTYEVKFSRFLINASVGEVTFEFLGRVPRTAPGTLIEDLNTEFVPDAEEKLIQLRASAFSKGVLTKLFGLTARDRFESLIDAEDFRARLSFRRIQEGKRNYAQTEIFARTEPALTQIRTDLAMENAILKKEAKPAPATLDLLGMFYFTRLQELPTGEILTVPVNDEAQQYNLEIIIGRREKISTSLGKFSTVRLEPQLFGEEKFFDRPGEMIVWLTDDDRRLPVRLVAKTSSGTVTATLIKASPQLVQAKKK